MANSNNLYAFPAPHQDQPSFNQNYMQQPMPNPEDITYPTTAKNMTLTLMAKAFKLNYLTPTNNNQRISLNPRNRQIAQPGMNMDQDRQMQMNVKNQVAQNPRVQNAGNQNVLIGVPGNANLNGNGNLVAARAEGNAFGLNGNQIRCYNYSGVGHYARNCTVRPRRRDAAYLQTQLLIAQKEEVGIQLQAEEFDLIAAVADLDEIEETDQLSVARKFLNEVKSTIVTLQRVVKHIMTLETHNWSSSAHQELHKIVKDENFPIVNQVDARVQNFEIQFLKEAAKFVGDFKYLVKEADESLAKKKALELEIKRLLRAVAVKILYTLNPLSQKLESENVELEFQVLNYARENAHLKSTYKNLFDSISMSRTQTKTLFASLQKQLHNSIYENAKLRAQLFNKVSDQKDNKRGMSTDTKFAKQSILGKPLMLGIDNTKTRRPQPRSNTKNDRVPSVSKRSRSKNKDAKVEDHYRNLLLSKNMKHMSSACNNVKLDSQNVISKVVFVMCNQCLISVNHDVCLLNYVNGKTSCGKKQKANVSIKEKQKKQKPKVKKPKKVGSIKRLAAPKPRKPRFSVRWSPTGRLFDLTGKNNRLPKFKYHKEHLCPSCEQSKSKRASHPPKPVLNSRQRQISSGLDLTYASSTITTQQPSEGELDLLFEAMYDDYIGGQPSATERTVPAAQEPQVRQTLTTSTTIANTAPTPTNSSSHSTNILITSQDVDELNQNALFDGNTFVNPFASPSTSAAESSSSHNNVKEAMTDPAWIDSMQEELLQFKRLDVWVLVPAPDNISPVTLKWLFKNKHDEEQTVIRNKSHLVVRGYAKRKELISKNPLLVQIHVRNPEKYGMESYDPIGTPMEIKDKLDLDQNGTLVNAKKYHSMIGALMYLASSRPDIVHATCLCARYHAKPTEKHLKEVKRILRYLRGTINTGLWYTKDSGFELTGFSDADYAGCKDTFKSTYGGAQFLEYVSLSACCAQVLWMRTQLTDYGFHFNKIPIYCDSNSAIAISCNSVQHSRTKHIAVRYHFIKKHVEKGTIKLYFVKTDYQLADLFTKALLVDRFIYLVRRLGMRSLSPQELDRLINSQ
uniref:Retrovirus-related Pol polyprotein from transposon TNT 1-94 n=1 Tax=Tanacetum cinerariifolium TaxID=118510 RepID=A0A6L2LVH6_TANCI|nr:retrovirus-related Pol polyprotein from transposon TNT 1-94 [Tanacetum cinerariifolium]